MLCGVYVYDLSQNVDAVWVDVYDLRDTVDAVWVCVYELRDTNGAVRVNVLVLEMLLMLCGSLCAN